VSQQNILVPCQPAAQDLSSTSYSEHLMSQNSFPSLSRQMPGQHLNLRHIGSPQFLPNFPFTNHPSLNTL